MRITTKHRRAPLTASGAGELKLTAANTLPEDTAGAHFTLATESDEAAPHVLDILCALSGTSGDDELTSIWLAWWHPLAGDSQDGAWRLSGPFPVAGDTRILTEAVDNCYHVSPPKNVSHGFVYWPSKPADTDLHVMVEPGD